MEKNTLIGKIIGLVFLLALIIIGVISLMNYLNKPSERFFKVMDEFTSDMSKANNVLDNNLEKILKGKKNINIDTKAEVLNLEGTIYEKYKDLFSYSLVSNIKIDTSNNYLLGFLEVTNDNIKYNINYVEEGTTKIMKGTNERYKHIKNNNFNLKALDKSIYSKMAIILRNKLITDIKKEDIKKEKTKLEINSNIYDANVSVYKVNGDIFKKMITKALNAFNEDSEISTYLIRVSGEKKSEDFINKLINNLNIDSNKTYAFKSYVEGKEDRALKLVIYEDNNILFSYEYDRNYRLLVIKDNSYELKGITNDFTLVISNDLTKTTLTYRGGVSDASGEVRVHDLRTDKEKYYIDYDYTITKNPASDSVSLDIKLHPTSVNSNALFDFKSSILISDIIKIDEEYTYNYLNDNRSDSSFKAIINEYLEKVYNYYNYGLLQ